MFGVNLAFAKGTNKYRFNIENYLFDLYFVRCV